ncbi:MAG: DUF5689 domain-containing protein [Bacteroidota bacterium]
MKRFYTARMTRIVMLSVSILFVVLLTSPAKAQVQLSVINSAYEEHFNSLASAGTTNDISTLPTGWVFLETGTNANTTYAAGTGSSNTGNTYSFGLDATDRALGGLLSGSLTPTIGASFVNNTGTTINALQITYHGEQWRLGATARGADRLDFQYSLNATALNNGVWVDTDALDFSSPITAGTVGALNGNDATNSSTLNFTISGLTIEPGVTFFLRWQDFNVASSDDGLAIDDFVLTPLGTPPNQPSIFFTPASLNFGEVNVNTSTTLSYEVTGSNLSAPISITLADSATFSLSIDGTTFGSSVMVPDSGTAVVYVKFSPTANGPFSDTIIHTSDSTGAIFIVQGLGFDQASNIISIASARTKSTGTKVTVAGRITVANEHGNPAFVQDATGGIPVFFFPLASGTIIGDSVIITGPIGVFNDQKQISGSGIFFTKVDTAPRIPDPKPIAIDQLAAHEGLLVTVQSVELVNKNFVFYPQSTERMTAGGIQADLRIDGDTNIPGLTKPQGLVDITGVVGRFRANAQLLPRFQSDIPGVMEPSTPYDSIPKNQTLDIVTWNFEFFGAEKEDYQGEEFGPSDEALQLQNIKQVLDSLNADIVAVEEVSSDSLFAVLVSQLGSHSFSCSPRFSYSFEGPSNEFPPQKVCFIFDTTTVDVQSVRVMFENLYDSARTVDPSLIPAYPSGDPSSFWSSGRLPYLLNAKATINGVTEDVSLVVLHAKSGSSVADKNRRAYDAGVLKDSLDTHFAGKQFIVLGDLNDDLDQSIAGGASPYAPFVDDTTHYTPVTKPLSEAGARSTVGFNDMIDHQIISSTLNDEYLFGSERVITPFREIPNYGNTTSDHLPVVTRFAFQAPRVAFALSSIGVAEGDSTQYVVNIMLNKPLSSAKQLVINLGGSASYGADFATTPAALNGNITLDLQAGDTTAMFTLTVIDDTADELIDSATFMLQSTLGLEVDAPSVFTLTIEDNDIPQLAFAQWLYTGVEGSGAHQIKFNLSGAPATDQTVTVQVYDGPGVAYGSDYTTNPAVSNHVIVVTIPAGLGEASFSLTPVDDGRKEFKLEGVLFYISNASEGLILNGPRISSFAIIDAEKPKPNFSISPNPTSGHIRVLSDLPMDDEIVHVIVRHNNGSLVFSGRGTLDAVSAAISARLQHERRGIYILKVMYEGDVQMIRFIKQ